MYISVFAKQVGQVRIVKLKSICVSTRHARTVVHVSLHLAHSIVFARLVLPVSTVPFLLIDVKHQYAPTVVHASLPVRVHSIVYVQSVLPTRFVRMPLIYARVRRVLMVVLA